MRRSVLLILSAALIGCDSATAPDTSQVGSYTLSSINEGGLYIQRSDRIDYFFGVIWLNADRTSAGVILSQSCFFNGCTSVLEVQDYGGTYTRANDKLTLTDSTSHQTTAWSYAGDQLTVTDSRNFSPPAVLIFTKDSVTRARN